MEGRAVGRKRLRVKGEVVGDVAGPGGDYDEEGGFANEPELNFDGDADAEWMNDAMTEMQDNKFETESVSSSSETGSGVSHSIPVAVSLEPSLAGSHDAPVAKNATKGRPARRREKPVPTHVEASVMASRTAVIVIAPDRPGLLERITASLSSQNLSVVEATIKTLPHGIARDTFDVVDASTSLPVRDAERLRAIEESVKNDLRLPYPESTKIRVNVPDRPGECLRGSSRFPRDTKSFWTRPRRAPPPSVGF